MIKSKRYFITLTTIVLLCSVSLQTSATYSITRTFDTSQKEQPQRIVVCQDGGFAIAGWTFIRNYDFVLIKTDQFGRMNWIHTYGTGEKEYCYGLVECADGGFALVGQILRISGWIVRTNPFGTPLWNLSVTEANTVIAQLSDVVELPNGDLLAAGYIWSKLLNHTDAWLIRIDANGTLKWSKTYGNSSQHQLCKSLILCQNGDLMLLGDTANNGNNLQNFWMIRVSDSGSLIWQKTFERQGNEYFRSAIETHDGGFVLTGMWDGASSWNYRMFLLRTDSGGNIIWNRTYSESTVDIGPDEDRTGEMTAGVDVLECEDNGFVVAGATNSFANYFPNNIWIVRTDEDGNSLWNVTRESDYSDNPESMAKSRSGELVIVASTRESVTSSDYDILLAFAENDAPVIQTTTSTPQGNSTNAILSTLAIVAGGLGIMLLIVLYIRRKKG